MFDVRYQVVFKKLQKIHVMAPVVTMYKIVCIYVCIYVKLLPEKLHRMLVLISL